MASRETARDQLVVLMNTITTFQTVYASTPKRIEARGPLGIVESAGTARGPLSTHDGDHRQHAFTITLLVRRDVADDAEDEIDSLSDEVFDVLEANTRSAGHWERMLPDTSFGPPLDYPDLPEQYRRERIRVIVWE